MHSDELWSNNDYRYYLAHHQIKGAHWGVMNGPPYPLSRAISTGKRLKESAGAAIKKGKAAVSKAVETHKQKVAEKKAAEEEKKIKKAVASSEVEQIEKIKDKLSTRDFEDAVKRAELNKRLQNADMRKSKLEKFTNALNTFTTVTSAGVGAWNNFARITNTFLDTDIPVIGKTGKDNKKKQSEDDKPKDKKPKDKKKKEVAEPVKDQQPDKSSKKPESKPNNNSQSNKKPSSNSNSANNSSKKSNNTSNKKKSSSNGFKNAKDFAKDFSRVIWPQDNNWRYDNSWVDDFVKFHPEDFSTPISFLLEDKKRAKHSDDVLEDYLAHHGSIEK